MANKKPEDFDKLIAQTTHQLEAYRGIEDRLGECSRWVAMLSAYGAPCVDLDQTIAKALSICGRHIGNRIEKREALVADKKEKSTAPYSLKEEI